MAAMENLCRIVGINPNRLSKGENILMEMELFYRVCHELKNHYYFDWYKYSQSMHFNEQMEGAMIDDNFVKCIVNDLLEEYSLQGIASYTDLPEDVIYELASGQNSNPSLKCIRKIIELHRSTRPNLYQTIVRKIVQEHQD